MVNYITLAQLTSSLNLYEFEIRTDGGSTYVVDDALTGVTSGTTFTIRRVLSATRYFVDTISETVPVIGETIGTAGGGSNQSVIQAGDMIVLESAIKRSQSLVEEVTHKKLLTQSETVTDRVRIRKRKQKYRLKEYPIISITSINIGGNVYEGTEDTLDGNGGDYYLFKESGVFEFKAERTDNSIADFTYTWGYDDTPTNLAASITQLVVDAMIHAGRIIWDRFVIESTAHGVTNISPAQFSMTFNFEQLFTEDFKTILSNQTRILLR